MPSPSALTHEIRQSFGEWFYKRRKTELGLSQGAIAEISGLSRQQIIRIEKGESGTTRESIPGLARALQVDESVITAKAGLSTDDVDMVPIEWRALWLETPIEARPRLLKATRGVKEAIAF
jgi:transcriptional regulator with XRE-family HTH domain